MTIPVTAGTLGGKGVFAKLSVAWTEDGTATVSVNGRETSVIRETIPKWGFSYLHLQALAGDGDASGSWIRSFGKRAK